MLPTAQIGQKSKESGLSRRAFLGATATTTLGITLPIMAGFDPAKSDINCILLLMVGGPSQIDTWDSKPNAPEEIRGPFRPIASTVPGLHVSELFPRLANQAHRWNVIRSLYHDAPPVHAAGFQLLQTGRFANQDNVSFPCIGSVIHYLQGSKTDIPPHVVLPDPIGRTGTHFSTGQSSSYLGKEFQPLFANKPSLRELKLVRSALDVGNESIRVRSAYGPGQFAVNCLQARRLIEQGVRFVTVNQFQTVFGQPTWDIHANDPFSNFNDMAGVVAPAFDQACSQLIEDLHDRGLLKTTIVVGVGEFGRSPTINPRGGRDHHTGVWSMLVAGGPFGGGKVIGASDSLGGEPKDRPVKTTEVVATLYQGLGISPHSTIPGPDGKPIALVESNVLPIKELF